MYHPQPSDRAYLQAATQGRARVPPWAEKKVRDSRLLSGCIDHAVRADLCSPIRLDADTPVVPVSLSSSMAVEGCHENRGLLPVSTSVRLLKLPRPPRVGHLATARDSREVDTWKWCMQGVPDSTFPSETPRSASESKGKDVLARPRR